jgi:hypothetical protein
MFTSWNTAFPEKLTGSQLVTKFPAYFEIRRLNTAFTRARHLSLSWARSIQSMLPFHFSKIRFNIILPSTPGSPKLSSFLRFRHRNPVCTSSLPNSAASPNTFQLRLYHSYVFRFVSRHPRVVQDAIKIHFETIRAILLLIVIFTAWGWFNTKRNM